jgi:hypothetical protein
MGVYNNNKDGTRSTIANTIQVVDAPMEQFVSRGEFNAIVPSDTSADNKLVNDDTVNDIWKVQGELGAKNLLVYPYSEVNITRAGISWSTDSDGTVYANGTSTSYSHIDLLTTHACKYKAGTYIFSLDENDNVGDIELIVRNGNNNYGYVTKAPYRLTFTITDEDVEAFASGLSFNIRVYLNAGKTAENLKIHPMLRYASDTDDTWQPYAPTNYQLNQKVDMTAGVYLPNATDISSKKVVASVGQTSVTFDANTFMTRYNVTSADLDLDISAETASGDVVSYNNVSVTDGIVTVTFDALSEQTIFICKCSVIQ